MGYDSERPLPSEFGDEGEQPTQPDSFELERPIVDAEEAERRRLNQLRRRGRRP